MRGKINNYDLEWKKMLGMRGELAACVQYYNCVTIKIEKNNRTLNSTLLLADL